MKPSPRSLVAKLSCCLAVACAAGAASAQNVAADYGKLPLSFEANQGQADSQVKFLSHGNGYALAFTEDAAIFTLNRTTRAGHPLRLNVPFNKAEWSGTPEHPYPAQVEPTSEAAALRASQYFSPYLSADPEDANDLGESAALDQPAFDTLRLQLEGATRFHPAAAESPLPGTANYFLGSDPAQWHTNIPTYARVKYGAVYPGIDLVYYGNQRQLEYDFVVAPGAEPNNIQLHFDGAKSLALTPNGDLRILVGNGEIAFHKPVIYQMKDGRHEPVEGAFRLLADNTIAFKVGVYDPARVLVIDPTLVYSTYLGGSAKDFGDYGHAIAVDGEGNAYIAGQTGSSDFPTTTGAFMTTSSDPGTSGYNAGSVAFVTKLNPAGTALVYSTYIGGSGAYTFKDSANAIVVDAAGDAYITGYTGSSNFPVTKSAYLKTNKPATMNGAYTAFVTKLNPAGTALIYSTYLGGSGLGNCCGPAYGDSGNGIAIDNAGDAFIGGTTYSSDFPYTAGAFQKVNNAKAIGRSNLFVTKLNPSGSALIASTYLGGSGYNEGCCYFFSAGDSASGVAIDGTGSAYITGTAYSVSSYPVTSDAYQKTNTADKSLNGTGGSNYNVVVSKLDPTFSTLLYSTYLGGTGNPYFGDAATGIAVDNSCYAYITGAAGSSDFPTTDKAFQTKDLALNYLRSSFITKFNTTGSALEYSTYLSGDISDAHETGDLTQGIQVDAAGQVYVTGSAQSLDFPVTSKAYQPKNAESIYTPADYYSGNAFIFELNADGSGPVYGSYLGGSGGTSGAGGDSGSAIALDTSGNAYITGHTLSTDFPILPNPGALQTAMPANAAGNQNNGNAFVAKFSIGSGAVLGKTETTITPDANPASADVKTTLTAYVEQNTACGFPPTGSASFVIDGGTPVKVTLDDTGHAAYSTTSLTVSKHTVAVSYSGDMKYKSSTAATLDETIVGPPTAVGVSSGTGQTAVYGSAFAKPLVVLVKDAQGGVAPGVVVNFAGTGLKFSAVSALTNEAGEASVSATATAAGSLKATATVSGITTAATFALTGTKAVLTFTAKSIKVPYDDAIPTLTSTVTGYVNGDSAKAYTGAPGETTTAKKGSVPGTYPLAIALGSLAAADYSFKFVNGTVTITNLGAAKPPTFTPVAGKYNAKQSVKLADAISGAAIYYTSDGSTPTTSSTKYKAPIAVTTTETIKAIATATGYTTSGVASAAYTLIVATPTFTPAAGTYSATQSVKLATTTPGATIYYTTDGTTPTSSSTKYSAAIPVSATETIKAIGVLTGYSNSAVAAGKYTIQ